MLRERLKGVVGSFAVAKKDRQIVIRIESEMGERIDAFTARLRMETGLDVSSGEAVRRLLALGLEAAEMSKRMGGD